MTIDVDDAYTAARLHAMRGRLLKSAEYERLLRMSDAEVLSHLQASAYRQDVDALGVRNLDDLEALDRVIARNSDRTLASLTHIASPRFAPLIDELRRANDAWNVRVAAEGIAGGVGAAHALETFARPGIYPVAPLAAAKTLEELKRIAAKRYPAIAHVGDTLAEILDALERARAQHPLPKDGSGALLADERNISRALRCSRDHVPVDRALAGMSRGGTLSRTVLRALATAKDMPDALRVLGTTRYREAATRTLAAGADAPLRIEAEVNRAVLRALARLSRADPLGPGILARYVAERGIEAVNLRLLVKAKRLGLDDAFVRERLVVN